ncbi:MAG: response regulator [Leptospiraceae bacterium]|nr:response regulator [Leptospiraceae bacterium]
MSKGYIICVDDEESVLETLQEQLKTHFGETNEIETALSAEDALELIDEILESGEIIELVISDQVMPGIKGDEFLEITHKKLPDAIKILLTGQAGLDSAINAINKGGLSRYVEKPWDIKTLSNDIRTLLDRFRQNLETQHLLNELNRRIDELEEENQKLKNT